MNITTQLQFETDRAGASQCTRVLFYLQACYPSWASLPKLVAESGGYAVHSRVADLRKQGHTITNMVDRSTKPYKSFYRYCP